MDLSFQLDQIDRELLAQLQARAKITNAQLAEHVGLAPASTLERVRKLESRGFIKSYHAKLDPKKLGLHTALLLQIKLHALTKEQVAAFSQAIATTPGVVECYQVVGSADFFAKVITTDLEAYQQVVMHRLSEIKEIKDIKSFVITAAVKEGGVLTGSLQTC